MSIEASGKNMQAVCKAKEVHDKTCVWGGKATEVHLAYFDIERMGWEEGDTIAGLVLQADQRIGTGTFQLVCDGSEPPEIEEREEDVIEAPAQPVEIPAGPVRGPA